MASQNGSLKRLVPPFDAIVVDGFNFHFPDCEHWILTHAHADHTCGLRGSFDATLYCSQITKDAIILDVSPKLADAGGCEDRIVVVEAGRSLEIAEVRVTPLDAGHCPGALIFLFERDGVSALHTGDFRASDAVIAGARAALGACAALDVLYLDTTYAKPAYRFPSQVAACEVIEGLVRRELEREPGTLFVVNTYSLGKEKALRAALRGCGGTTTKKALVTARRAHALKFCGLWTDEAFTEDPEDPAVQVWVGSTAPKAADREAPQAGLLALLEGFGAGRFTAVCALRCTGWEYKKSDDHALCGGSTGSGGSSSTTTRRRRCANAAACDGRTYAPRPWVEHGGRTRSYGIPFSDHSSFDELKRFVRAVRPKRLIPTVNAETRDQRDALKSLFADGLDLAHDRSTMDAFLSASSSALFTPRFKTMAPAVCYRLDRVDVDAQRAQLALFQEAAPSSSKKMRVAVDPDVLRALREIIGAERRTRDDDYIDRLAMDAGGSLETAVAMHFSSSNGDDDDDDDDGPSPHGGGPPIAAPPAKVVKKDEEMLPAFGADLAAAVFCVRGADVDFRLHKVSVAASTPRPEEKKKRKRAKGGAASKVASRLADLGLCVTDKMNKATHVLVPEGTDPATLTGLRPTQAVVQESWLVRCTNRLKAGLLEALPVVVVAAAAAAATEAGGRRPRKGNTRQADVGPGGEKRQGRRRRPTRETDGAIARALAERMFLVARRSPGHFAVAGSTGNVYDVHIARTPTCTCPYARDHPDKVCKHRLFVLIRALGLPYATTEDDSDADDADSSEQGAHDVVLQRYLRGDELRMILARETRGAGTEASEAARRAYARQGGGATTTSPKGDDDDPPAPRARHGETCAICFDDFGAALDDVDACVACGKNVHSECFGRWVAHNDTLLLPRCASCRALWPQGTKPRPQGTSAGEEEHGAGYVNIRNVQPGLRCDRDASTYGRDALSGRTWAEIHAERRLARRKSSSSSNSNSPWGPIISNAAPAPGCLSSDAGS